MKITHGQSTTDYLAAHEWLESARWKAFGTNDSEFTTLHDYMVPLVRGEEAALLDAVADAEIGAPLPEYRLPRRLYDSDYLDQLELSVWYEPGFAPEDDPAVVFSWGSNPLDALALQSEGDMLSYEEASRVRIEFPRDPESPHGPLHQHVQGDFKADLHSADWMENEPSPGGPHVITEDEMLLVMDYFDKCQSENGYLECDPNLPPLADGYLLTYGARGNTACDPHDSDYLRGADWRIGLTELLRVIQFFNTGPLGGLPDYDWSYHRRKADEPATEDGWTPGGAPPE